MLPAHFRLINQREHADLPAVSLSPFSRARFYSAINGRKQRSTPFVQRLARRLQRIESARADKTLHRTFANTLFADALCKIEDRSKGSLFSRLNYRIHDR